MDDELELVARAIYMTHWDPGPESVRGLDHRFPPTWETASDSVKEFIRKQADSARKALLQVRGLV